MERGALNSNWWNVSQSMTYRLPKLYTLLNQSDNAIYFSAMYKFCVKSIDSVKFVVHRSQEILHKQSGGSNSRQNNNRTGYTSNYSVRNWPYVNPSNASKSKCVEASFQETNP